MRLTEKYRPKRIGEFAGLERAKKMLSELASTPEPLALLMLGPPGTGKTTMALAFARELNGALVHVPAQKCTVESVARVWEDVHYYPPMGRKWWVVLVDEADQMSRAAQLALLSHLDSTANLAFDFGGSMRETEPLPVIWIFTANGSGANGTLPPAGFEARFLSRCVRLAFPALSSEALSSYSREVWERETGERREFAWEAGLGLRDVLNELEGMLLEPAELEAEMQLTSV